MKKHLQNFEETDRVLNITLNAAQLGLVLIDPNEQIKYSVKNHSVSLSTVRMR